MDRDRIRREIFEFLFIKQVLSDLQDLIIRNRDLKFRIYDLALSIESKALEPEIFQNHGISKYLYNLYKNPIHTINSGNSKLLKILPNLIILLCLSISPNLWYIVSYNTGN